jgi:hypothetical protein
MIANTLWVMGKLGLALPLRPIWVLSLAWFMSRLVAPRSAIQDGGSVHALLSLDDTVHLAAFGCT